MYSLVPKKRHDRKKMTRMENGPNIRNRASSIGSQYGYLAFGLNKFRNCNPILRPFSSHIIFFPIVSLFWNQRVTIRQCFMQLVLVFNKNKKSAIIMFDVKQRGCSMIKFPKSLTNLTALWAQLRKKATHVKTFFSVFFSVDRQLVLHPPCPSGRTKRDTRWPHVKTSAISMKSKKYAERRY